MVNKVLNVPSKNRIHVCLTVLISLVSLKNCQEMRKIELKSKFREFFADNLIHFQILSVRFADSNSVGTNEALLENLNCIFEIFYTKKLLCQG